MSKDFMNLGRLSVASVLLLASFSTMVFAQADSVAKWKTVSEKEQIAATIYPQKGDVTIGQFQRWVLQLSDADGKYIYPARISIGGGMPAHGHGLPTQPQVTEYLGEGKYLIEGMKFNMGGDWVLAFGVDSEQAIETLRFKMVLGY